MPAYVNVPDIVKIGLIAVAAVWLINAGLNKFNLDEYSVN